MAVANMFDFRPERNDPIWLIFFKGGFVRNHQLGDYLCIIEGK